MAQVHTSNPGSILTNHVPMGNCDAYLMTVSEVSRQKHSSLSTRGRFKHVTSWSDIHNLLIKW